MKKSNKLYIIIILLLIVIMIVGAWYLLDSLNKSNAKITELEKNIETNKVENTTTENNTLSNSTNKTSDSTDTKIEQIKNFLTTNEKIISPENVVGSGYPAMYCFTNDGKFAYYSNNPTKENRTLSYVGTWDITDNNLILSIKQEKKAIGGEEVTQPYIGLENYSEEISNSNYTIKYKIVDFIKDENITYNTYLKLDKLDLFQLSIAVEEDNNVIKELRDLANKGSY